jgi:uncharacterized protein
VLVSIKIDRNHLGSVLIDNITVTKGNLMRRVIVGLLLSLAATGAAKADFLSAYASYRKGDYATAAAAMQGMAQGMDPVACYFLGIMNLYGNQNFAADPDRARVWFEEAAGKGFAMAEYNLGVMYLYGRGVPTDYAAARDWLIKASDHGVPRAKFQLGRIYEKGLGVPRDMNEAKRQYRDGTEQARSSVDANSGALFINSESITLEFAQSREWYLGAAAKGDAEAELNAGMLYATGKGIQRNYVQAYLLLGRAAAQGMAEAARQQAMVKAEMTPAELERAKSAETVN